MLCFREGHGENMPVWCSTLQRTQQTAAHFPGVQVSSACLCQCGANIRQPWKALDELDAGECDGLTYAEIEVSFVLFPPLDYAVTRSLGAVPRIIPAARAS